MSKSSENRLISKCKSWADFTAAVEKLDKKQMGDVFERLTQLYLQTKSEYKTSLKNVWALEDVPGRVRKKIKNLPATDEGIDLVAETREGEFWAIQSKYRTDKDKPLTYKELSTFTNLAFNTCKGTFVQAVVVHTVSKPVKKRKLLGNTVEIGLQRWLEMDANHWTLIRRTIGNKPARPKKRTPRPHQRKAIRAAAKHFVDNKESRGKLIMPCGTGKSLTAFWIANQLKAKTVLLVVPSLALIKQSVEDWTQEMVARGENPLPEWLCICSDESAGSVSKDDFVSDTYATGLPVTTDAKKIGAFLKKRTSSRKIVFVTYQSSPVFAKAARRAGANFDLAVLDEAHKTAGEKSKAFATLLFDKNLPIKKRIFMTATERVMRGAHDDVVSMDKVDIYGDCFYQLSFKEAIHSDPPIISDYRILTIFVTEDEIRSAIKDRQFVSDRKSKLDAKDSRELASAIALRKAYKKYRIKHAVSFHRSIQGASDFSDLHETLNASTGLRPKVECFHVSSKKTTGQRTQLLKDFADSKRSLITNARCLTEGVDVPAIDCVLFADPKQSTVDIVQAAGRALRPHADKKFGYIMLPIIVPKGKTVDKFAETTEFKTVSRVITALSTNDERIAEEFRVAERGKRRRGEIVQFDGNVPVGMKIDLEAFADAISAKVWERAAKVNWRPFEEAKQFAQGLKLKGRDQWSHLSKTTGLPHDIPVAPRTIYMEKGWQGWGDWLGTGRIANMEREYRSFGEARKFARSLNLKSSTEWFEYTKSGDLPEDIPVSVNRHYEGKGWKGFGDWLGTGNVFSQPVRSFKEAREFARRLDLKNQSDWRNFAKTDKRPKDIPAAPATKYKGKGWKSWGDWLGTNYVAHQNRKHRTFKEARKFVRSLRFKSGREWEEFSKSEKRPADIPAYPKGVYKNTGWISMGDWIGSGNVAAQLRTYRPFKEARKFARTLNLKSGKEWANYAKSGKLPRDIPAAARNVYIDKSWQGWGDWLGTGAIAPGQKKFRSFKEARKFARSLKLKTGKEWSELSKAGKLPEDIPSYPNEVYRDSGWKSMGDWLGTGTVAHQFREYRPFVEARKFARSLKLKNREQWERFKTSGNLPDDIPSSPQRYKGWKGWGDWLDTGNLRPGDQVYRSFRDARKFARSLKLKTGTKWSELSKAGKLPKDIPSNPNQFYKDAGWKSMGDWLGTGNVHRPTYRSFAKARKFARTLKLKAGAEWREYAKSGRLPKDIPASAPQVYKDKGWLGWGDWLGTGNVRPGYQEYRSFNEARKFARSLKLKSQKEWGSLSKAGKLPKDIPGFPERPYKGKGWKSWGDWLGTGYVHSPEYRSFSEARKFARSLNLKSSVEWYEFAKTKKRPADIPIHVYSAYAKKGWKGIPDFLGYKSSPGYRSKRKKKNLNQSRVLAN